MWVLLAVGSALFAGLTSILAKCGIKHTDSTLATAIRTIIVLLFSCLMVLIVGSAPQLGSISGKTLLFLTLSGLATGASWLCYFRALQIGDINKVVPIDKSSTILTILLAFLFLGEPVSAAKGLGVLLIGTGTYLMIDRKDGQKSDVRGTLGAFHGRASGLQDKLINETQTAGAACGHCVSFNAERSDFGNDVLSENQTVNFKTGAACGWMLYAAGAAVFAALTAILGKIGISGVESNLGTAIRTLVVLIMAWMMVFVSGKAGGIKTIPRRELLFICLSGLATGASWLCYYRALRDGPASVVVPIDKLSILVTVAFSRAVFGERLSLRAALGLAGIVLGTLVMI